VFGDHACRNVRLRLRILSERIRIWRLLGLEQAGRTQDCKFDSFHRNELQSILSKQQVN
jgi:hypothetical protein